MAARRVLRLVNNFGHRKRGKRVYRQRIENFEDVSDERCFFRYRFRKETIYFIVNLLTTSLRFATRRNKALTPLIQVLVALRYFATGGMLRLVGDTFGLSVPTVHRCIHRVAKALCSLSHRFIIFPSTEEDVNKTKAAFFRLSGFPDVVGAVDGTFVPIQAPQKDEQDFVNRNGFHSLNVQMTSNANFLITSINANWPGSVHDSRIFRTSKLQRNFENGTYNGILLGDSAYPCKRYIMTPYTVTDTKAKERFNKALCRSRVVIEQTYGILKRRFACLKFMRFSPEKSCYVTVACGVLHNIGILKNDIVNREDIISENDVPDVRPDNEEDGNMMRDFICQEYFS